MCVVRLCVYRRLPLRLPHLHLFPHLHLLPLLCVEVVMALVALVAVVPVVPVVHFAVHLLPVVGAVVVVVTCLLHLLPQPLVVTATVVHSLRSTPLVACLLPLPQALAVTPTLHPRLYSAPLCSPLCFMAVLVLVLVLALVLALVLVVELQLLAVVRGLNSPHSLAARVVQPVQPQPGSRMQHQLLTVPLLLATQHLPAHVLLLPKMCTHSAVPL